MVVRRRHRGHEAHGKELFEDARERGPLRALGPHGERPRDVRCQSRTSFITTDVCPGRHEDDQDRRFHDPARSPRFEVLRCLRAIDATRLHERRRWVVSGPNLRPFGPRRDRDRRSSRDSVRTGSNLDQRPPIAFSDGDESRRRRGGAATLQNAEISHVSRAGS